VGPGADCFFGALNRIDGDIDSSLSIKGSAKVRLGIISTRPVFNCHPPDCGNAPAARAINFYEVEPDFHHILAWLRMKPE